jgi:hypothetical protein
VKIVDGEGLWKALVAEGLTEKRVGEMSLQEVELLAAVFADHVDGDVAPFWNGKDLVVPFAAPYACRWWRHKFKPAERLKLLREAGVPPDKYTMYMDKRDIGMAEGKVDESGNEIRRADDKGDSRQI